MAARSAANLKADATAADTALATAIASPTVANINSAIAAFATVVTNGRDSEYARSAQRVDGPSIGRDLQVLAQGASRDLQLILRRTVDAQGNADVNATRKALKRVQSGLALTGSWKSITSLPTTS